MISKISLSYFKKFKGKTVDLQPLSILVGENSSGKTTILQAINLSLSALAGSKLVSIDSNGDAVRVRQAGISANSLPGISIADFRELYYAKISRGGRSGDSRLGATILLEDDNGNKYNLQVSSLFGGYNIKCMSTPEDFKKDPKLHLYSPLFISGFVGLQGIEERSFPAVIKKHLSSGMVSSIVRNLVLELKRNSMNNYELLQKRMEKDFGFHLGDVDFDDKSDEYVTASYYEECESRKLSLDFNSSGSGYMQILQILAPIYSVCPDQCKIVLLDEPDAHLHPNMQIALAKSLIQIQRELDVQIIISTHSPAIIQTVSPSSIIPITANNPISSSLTNDREVHDFLAQIDNYELAKSVISGKIVFFEDADTSILEAVDAIIDSKVFYGLNTTSIHKAKGKDDKFPFQIHEHLKQYLGKEIEIHFVRDRDGLSDEWCERLMDHAQKHNVFLHILKRYEIENYILNSSSIKRAIENKYPQDSSVPTEEEIQLKLTEFLKNTICLSKYGYDIALEDNIFKTALLLGDDKYRGKNATLSEATKLRSTYEEYSDYASLICVGAGKKARGQLLNWLNHDRKLKIDKQDLLDALHFDDIPDELINLLADLRSSSEETDDIYSLEDVVEEDGILTEDVENNQLSLWCP